MQITIDLSDEESERLQGIADSLGIAPSELARAAFADLLALPDDDFRRAAEHVLQKNKQLYERLR
jgi:predicted transcriptional regulator